MSNVTILRGRVLDFNSYPQTVDDTSSFQYEEDGAVVVSEGLVCARGSFSDISKTYPDATINDHRPNLILPGFIDTHNHFPQMQVIGSFGSKITGLAQHLYIC